MWFPANPASNSYVVLEYIHSATVVSCSMVTLSRGPRLAAYDLRKTQIDDLIETYSRETWIASLENLRLFASRLEAAASAYHAWKEKVEASAARTGYWGIQIEI